MHILRGITLKKKSKQFTITVVILIFAILGVRAFLEFVYVPKNSIELYQAIMLNHDDNYNKVQKLTLDGYEDNFSEKVYKEILNSSTLPTSINQFTVIQYEGESFLIETTPGTLKLEILRVVKLPQELKDYISELTK